MHADFSAPHGTWPCTRVFCSALPHCSAPGFGEHGVHAPREQSHVKVMSLSRTSYPMGKMSIVISARGCTRYAGA